MRDELFTKVSDAGQKIPDEFLKELEKEEESIQLEIGVKGKSGHWGHSSQPGHRGGSLPKDGQLSLGLDVPAGKKTVQAMLDTAVNAIIKHSSDYDTYGDVVVGSPSERAKVDAEIRSLLEKTPREWAEGVEITLYPDVSGGVPWGQYHDLISGSRIAIYVGHIKDDVGYNKNPHAVHGFTHPWGNWIQYTATCVAHEVGHHAWKVALSDNDKNAFDGWLGEAGRHEINYPRDYGLQNPQEFFCTNYETWIRGHKELMELKVWDWFEENAKPKRKHESYRVRIKREGASLVEYGLSIRAGRCGHAEHGGPTPLSDQMPPLFPNMRLIEYGVKGKSGHWGHQSQKGHKGGSLPKDGQGSLSFDTKSTAPPEMKSPEQSIDDLVAKIYANTADSKGWKYGMPSKTLDEMYDFKTQIAQVLEQIPPGWGEGINKLTIRTVAELPGGVPKKMGGDIDIAGEYYVADKNIDIWFEAGNDFVSYTGVRGIVTHEVGHHIWYTKLSDVERERFKNWHSRAVSGFDIYPTRYSLKNEDEFFCENLRYYVIGRGQELLSTEVFEWMERNVGSLSFRGIQPLKPGLQYPKGLPDRETVKQIRRFKGGSVK